MTRLLGPIAVLAAVGAVGTATGSYRGEFTHTLVNVAIVVALYVFVGNSGVLSFGQVSFVAVGAFSAGLMTIPANVKPGVLPDLFPFLKHHAIGNAESLLLATGIILIGAAAIVFIPRLRLSLMAIIFLTRSGLGLATIVFFARFRFRLAMIGFFARLRFRPAPVVLIPRLRLGLTAVAVLFARFGLGLTTIVLLTRS